MPRVRGLRGARIVGFLAAVCVAIGHPAAAQADDASAQAEGAVLKQEGDDLSIAKRYEEALAKYELAYAKTRNPALLYNRARALEVMARYPEALLSLQTFAVEASAPLRAKVPDLDAYIEEIRKKTTRLTVTCNVQNARIVLRDRVLGATPLTGPVVVNAGAGTLEVSADGYFTWSRPLVLPAGGELPVLVTLSPTATSGMLTVRSAVAGARVSVDGKGAGLAPAELTLAAGAHEIVVMVDGRDRAVSRIVLAPGERRELVSNPEERPLTAKWWFWAGVGVVVTGVTIGTYVALTTEKDGTKGDGFSPSNVRVPLVTFP
jgi:hypothetical protein